MTVAELITALKDCSPELSVCFAYDYGDRSHTLVCETVNCIEREQPLVFSDYHGQHRLPDEFEELPGDAPVVVVLRGRR